MSFHERFEELRLAWEKHQFEKKAKTIVGQGGCVLIRVGTSPPISSGYIKGDDPKADIIISTRKPGTRVTLTLLGPNKIPIQTRTYEISPQDIAAARKRQPSRTKH